MIRRAVIAFAVVANLVFADALTKELASGCLKGEAPVSVIGGFFNLAYVENRGCAWGMFQGSATPLAFFALAALVFLFWKRKSVFAAGEGAFSRFAAFSAECLAYAGIAGNLIDRVARGYVIDFLDFHCMGSHFPCFNLADAYITLAVVAMLSVSFADKTKQKRK